MANPSAAETDILHVSPRRRLSWWRLAVLMTLLVGASAVGLVLERSAAGSSTDSSRTTGWFAPYVDTTLTPLYQFQDRAVSPVRDVVLGFVVSDPKNLCAPSWGGAYSPDGAARELDLDRRVARLRQQAGDAIVSFGGQANMELAVGCTDGSALLAAYRSIVDRYHVTTVDFDVEGDSLKDDASFSRRAVAVKQLQTAARKAHHGLAVWLTLPVSPSGLPTKAVQVLDAMLAARVDVAGVNAMTMDFGQSRPATQSMIDAVEQALTETSRQVRASYQRAGINLTPSHAWAKVGVTPMIGQNDTPGDLFDLPAARALTKFVKSHGIARVSMWSLNRDTPCGPNVVAAQTVLNSCSGLPQIPLAFSKVFSKLPARATAAARAVTRADRIVIDVASKSPYPIWDARKGYVTDYKVVWRGYVFQAKWWSQGVPPDEPVVHAWQTPWRLIGPVLPGERPAKIRTFAQGTYPEWSGTATYVKGDRVFLRGLPYEAKWWTKGDSPEASASNPWDSPWRPLFSLPGEPATPEGIAPVTSPAVSPPG